jgi:hypothetical protein
MEASSQLQDQAVFFSGKGTSQYEALWSQRRSIRGVKESSNDPAGT